MPYNSAKYEFLFDLSGENTERAFDRFRHRNVFRYRTRTIKAGNVLEVEIFPIWNTQNEVREAKKHTTREAQKNLNDKNAKKKFIRKINANFTEEDLCVTLTYSNGFVPDEEQARRDIRNYLRRVREYHRKNGLPELKYAYVIEFGGKDGRRKRVHHHVISAEMSVEVAEAILYADDGADEVVKEFVSGELTLNVNDLMPADLAAILGQTQDDDQVVYAGENDDPPYMAIGFRAKKANGMYKYIWLYKVKFAIPSESYQTKGDSIEFTTPEITGQFIHSGDKYRIADTGALPAGMAEVIHGKEIF